MKHRRRTARPLLALLGAAALAGCSTESPPPPPPVADGLPASWDGIWSVTLTVLDCESGGVVQETTSEQVFCEGDPLRFDFDEPLLAQLTCTDTVDDATFELVCSQTFAATPDCDLTIHASVNGTKTGDTFSGAGSLTTTNEGGSGGGCDEFLLCFDLTIDGTREGDTGARCP